MGDKYWYLKNCDLFSRLSQQEIEAVESRSRSKSFGRGGLVYLPADQGDSLLLLTSGRVKLYHVTQEGKQASLAIIDPGEVFGELSVFERAPRDEFAEAMEKSNVVLIPADVVQELMARHADVSLGVTKLMGFRRRRVEQRLKSLLFRSNRERLGHLLLELVEKYGQRTPDGVLLGIRLSHQELANIIGSTRETVTVVLGEMQDEGLVVVQRRKLVLREIGRLAGELGVPVPPVRGGGGTAPSVVRT